MKVSALIPTLLTVRYNQYATRYWLASIGLIQGAAVWVAIKLWQDDPKIAAIVATVVAFVCVWGLLVQFSWARNPNSRFIAVTAGIAGLFAIVTLWVWWQIPGKGAEFAGDNFRAFTLVPASLIALYALLPFLQIFHENGWADFPYPELFRHSWNNFFIASIGALFAGVFWGLIVLWVALFKVLGISFFADIFFSAGFTTLATGTMFGVGIALGKEGNVVINTLRRITLVVFQFLMPMLVLIALLFLVALPFTGLQPLWSTRSASPLLFSVLGLTILFINAAIQDLSGSCPYSIWVKHAVEVLLLAAPIFSALTFYAIGLRISQYGMTPERFYVVLFALITGLYAVGYAVAVIRRGDVWLSFIRPINLGMSLIVATLALLVHTPALDPLAWSARSQYYRLMSGKTPAETFDYGTLRFQLGRVGYERLLALEKLENHPQREIVRNQVGMARKASSYYVWQQSRSSSPTGEYLQIFSTAMVPQDLIENLFRSDRDYLKHACVKNKDCALFSLNLDDDPGADYLLITSGKLYRVLLYDRNTDGGWRYVGEYRSGKQGQVDREAVIEQLKQSQIVRLQPAYQDLKIGDNKFELYRQRFPE
jgi:hypothetical protein